MQRPKGNHQNPLLLLIWWLASLYPSFSQQEADLSLAISATLSGSTHNSIVVVSFALIGALSIRPAIAVLRSNQQLYGPLLFLASYLAWSTMSIAWSAAPDLSLRRVVPLHCYVWGGLAIALGYYSTIKGGPTHFIKHVTYAGAIACVALWLPRLGHVSILDPTAALRGVGLGTHIGQPIAFATISLVALATMRRGDESARLLPSMLGSWIVVFVMLLSLFMLKGRAMVLAAALGCLVLMPARIPRSLLLITASFTIAVGLVVSLMLINGLASTETLEEYVRRGEPVENLYSLTGRIPLWEYLTRQVLEQPLLGYGFGAFWSAERLVTVWSAVGWPAVVAHNGPLDLVLGTGLVGLVLFGAFWARAVALWIARARTNPQDVAPMGAYLVLYFGSNVTDSVFHNYYFGLPVMLGAFVVSVVGAEQLRSKPSDVRRFSADSSTAADRPPAAA